MSLDFWSVKCNNHLNKRYHVVKKNLSNIWKKLTLFLHTSSNSKEFLITFLVRWIYQITAKHEKLWMAWHDCSYFMYMFAWFFFPFCHITMIRLEYSIVFSEFSLDKKWLLVLLILVELMTFTVQHFFS